LGVRGFEDIGRLIRLFPGAARRLGTVVLALAFSVALLAVGAPAQARYASIVADFETGEILQETNADTQNYPASLTKIMTLYLAFEALQRGDLTLDQELNISRRAAGMPSSKLGLRAGEKITVRNTIMALITKSANDAAVVMAEGIAGKEYKFARLMTKKARELGMSKTRFQNASGLPNRSQVSTARDMSILARALIRDYPRFYELFATPQFTYRGQIYKNHNRLLSYYEGTDGIKTGYIRASGFNLVASAVRGGRRLIAVVFGGKTPRSRDRQIANLMDAAFAQTTSVGIAKVPAPPAPKPVQVVADLTGTPVIAAAAELVDIGEGDIDVAQAGSIEEAALSLAWGVQVGAFYQQRAAERAALAAATRAPDLLSDAQVLVTDIRGQRGRIFRARLIGLSETGARDACSRLKAAKVDCLVVQVDANTAFQSNRRQIAVN
jgi:D-alanyl-D-alanine carboxypeptidase